MRKLTYLFLCAVVFIAATSAMPIEKGGNSKNSNKGLPFGNMPGLLNLSAPANLTGNNTAKTVMLEGKMVNGKLVVNKKPGYVYQLNTLYIVFVWQDEGSGNYDLRLQEAKYDPALSIIPTSVTVNVTANVTVSIPGYSTTSNLTIPANAYNGFVDAGTYNFGGAVPTLTTNYASPGTVHVGTAVWPVVVIQFPADVHP